MNVLGFTGDYEPLPEAIHGTAEIAYEIYSSGKKVSNDKKELPLTGGNGSVYIKQPVTLEDSGNITISATVESITLEDGSSAVSSASSPEVFDLSDASLSIDYQYVKKVRKRISIITMCLI